MNKYWEKIFSYTFGVTTALFSFLPNTFFSNIYSWTEISKYWCDTINRVIFLIIVGFFIGLLLLISNHFRKKLTLHGHNYKIIVKYGDIFKQKNCKKVINFDECYTTEIGNAIHQIKSTSLCGKFLERHNVNISSLLSNNGIKPAKRHSKYNGKLCYEPGTLLPYNDEFLLMAFAKLNKDGRAVMSREEYLSCLNKLWKEINNYYSQTDVAIAVLGSGVTHFKGEELTQQQLIDIIIYSYKLSTYKIKSPNTLNIICRKSEDFNLNKVCENL